MGFFSWNCKGCNQSIKAPYGLPKSIAWQNNAVVLIEYGSRIIGHYDGYGCVGHIDVMDGSSGDDMEWWHYECWLKAGKPNFTSPSTDARDQGYFYDSEDEDEDEEEDEDEALRLA